MKRRAFLSTLASMPLSLLGSGPHAQGKPPRIAIFTPLPPNSMIEQGLPDGLRELGYVEGKNVVIERRNGVTSEQLHSAADALVATRPDVIIVNTTPATGAILDATKSIPVVFLVGDPVATGFAASLARPSGNATGLSLIYTDLTAKRLELLLTLLPRARRIACLINSSNPIGPPQFEEARKAGRTLGLEILKLDARNTCELDAVLRALPHSSAASPASGGGRGFLNAPNKRERPPALPSAWE